jgi:tetratricopeptide (TPR) repeat protein
VKTAFFWKRSLSALFGFGMAVGNLGCGALSPPVARTVNGVTSEGRFIEPDAYALYSVAALREARGQWREALALYERALEVDSEGPEIRTRIAAVACKLRQHKLADGAFTAALRKDDEYGPGWFELAQCRRARGDLAGAESAALRALELDPERHETSLILAEILEQRGDRAGAWRLRDALATHAAQSLTVQRQLLSAALRAGDKARAERAQRSLSGLNQRQASFPAPRGVKGALEALARGDVTTARREAELVLGADPGNGDALVIALSAADLEQDHAAFARLLARAAEPGKPASPAVLDALEALLVRRVSAQAGRLVREQ